MKAAATGDPCARLSEPAFPHAPDECVAPPEPATGGPASCVPPFARGRELARDDELHMNVYEACLPESRFRVRAAVRVDARRVIVERAGERPASDDELQVLVGRLSLDLPTVEPALAAAPWLSPCRDDKPQEQCLAMNLVAAHADLPALMAALDRLMPIDPVCVPMKVEFGVPMGCPNPADKRHE